MTDLFRPHIDIETLSMGDIAHNDPDPSKIVIADEGDVRLTVVDGSGKELIIIMSDDEARRLGMDIWKAGHTGERLQALMQERDTYRQYKEDLGESYERGEN